MSDQEHQLHRVRDRVRIRLNLIDIDFRNLHGEIEALQRAKTKRPEQIIEMLDGDHNNESEKERPPTPNSEDEMDEVQLCIRKNKRLMQL